MGIRISNNRLCGKTRKYIVEMAARIKIGQSVGVLGLEDHQKYLNEFKKLGIDVMCEPQYRKTRNTLIFDEWGEPIGIRYNKKIHIGYIFYCN